MRVLLFLSLAALAGCARPTTTAPRPEGVATDKRPYTRKQLENRIMGASRDQVRERIGAPDKNMTVADGDNEGYWGYEKLTVDPATGKPDRITNVWFSRDVVDRITYNP